MAGALGRYAEMSVLVVDDNAQNLALLKAAIERAGLPNVVTEADARAVSVRLAEQSPDLVVLDLHMPGADGHQILAQIREYAAESYLPVLIMTGDVSAESRYRALRNGAQDFLVKPVDIVEATLRIANLLETRHLYETVRRGRRWLAASGELTNQLVEAQVEQPITRIADAARHAAEADFVILTAPQGDGNLRAAAVSGELASGLTDRIISVDASIAHHALQAGEPELVSKDRAIADLGPDAVEVGPLIVAPLLSGERALGALILGRIAARPHFAEVDLNLAASFATQAAVALDLVAARDAELLLARIEDRNRIAADIHDHVIQDLFAVIMGLQGLASITDHPTHISRINGYIGALDNAVKTLRTTIFQAQSHRHEHSQLQQQGIDRRP